MFKRLIIIGAGAVGGSIGGLVFETGFPVVLVARGQHGKTIRDEGLNLRMNDRSLLVHPPCFENVAQVDWQPGDVAMIATKLQDAEAVMDELLTATGSHIPIVCATNGIHAERWASTRFENALSTLVWMPALHLKPGQVDLHSGRCRAVLDTGPVQFENECSLAVCESFCQILQKANFDALVRNDIAQWKVAKWINNLGNAAQALVADDWQSVAKAAQAEGEAIVDSAGLPHVSMQELRHRTSHLENIPIEGQIRPGGSTWQSLQRGHPMETPWIEGAMVELADEVGLPAPILRFLNEVAKKPRPLTAHEVLQKRII